MKPNKQKNSFTLPKRIIALLGALFLLSIWAIFCFRTANYEKYQTDEENSVNYEDYIELNGVRQFIRVRGKNKNNPVILFLHGGPCNPLSCVSYLFTDELYENYTVCEWDQRGCGRTYINSPTPPTDISEITEDVDSLVKYLKKEYNEKIILMGYSWGSVAGLNYASVHGKELLAYIGVGQCVNMSRGINASYKKYLNEAEDTKYGERLYAQFIEEGGDTVSHFSAYNTLMNEFYSQLGGSGHSGAYYFLNTVISADSSVDDIRWKILQAGSKEFAEQVSPLAQYMYADFDAYEVAPCLNCPAFFITGENDLTMPYSLTNKYSHEVISPISASTAIPCAGHSVMFDDPKAFANSVNGFISLCE